jgi:hypothetical protein
MAAISGRNRMAARMARVFLVTGLMAFAGTAKASQINVGTNCSLLEAVQAANTNTAVHGCMAGSPGADLIKLASTTYSLTSPLQISEAVEIRGNGATSTTIQGGSNNGPVDDCEGFSAALYIFVPPTDAVQLTNLTLRQISGSPTGGICLSSGRLILNSTRVTGFQYRGIHAQPNNTGTEVHVLVQAQSEISSNRSPGSGAGILVSTDNGQNQATLTITQSAIVNNSSEGSGGGVFFAGEGGNNHIEDSTISGNLSFFGGGVALDYTASYFEIDRSTIANNHALNQAGGVGVFAANGVQYNDTIITNNISDGDAQQANLSSDFSAQPTTSCNSSLIYAQGSEWQNPPVPPGIGGNCIFNVADAKLATLAGQGGPNNLPIHALLAGSPALHAKNVGPTPGNFYGKDQRGIVRPQFVDASGNTWIDTGAYTLVPYFETESLAAAASGAPHVVVMGSQYHAGQGTNLQATASGPSVIYTTPPLQAGTYSLVVGVKKGTNGGIFRLSKAETFTGTYTTIGSTQDTFASSNTWVALTFPDVTITTTGAKYFKLTVTGRSSSNAGFQLFPDYILLTKK